MGRWSLVAALVWAAAVQAQGSGYPQGYGYGFQQSYPLPSNTPPMNAPPPPRPAPPDEKSWLEGVSVILGGGVEGYTGSLSSRVAIGPSWSVILGLRPSPVFGIELAYVGGLNSVKYDSFGMDREGGADIVRHGGQANVTFALGAWQVQPFVLAGVGFTRYSVSEAAQAVGFSSTTAGYIPVGGGVRFRVQGVTVDLRGSWQLPFSDGLFPGGTGQDTLGLDTGSYRRWTATLSVGGTF